MSNNVERNLQRIQAYGGNFGRIIVNADGTPIFTTFNNTTTLQYASLLSTLTNKAKRLVKDLDPSSHLEVLQIKSKKHEFLVTIDGEFKRIVVIAPAD